MIMNEVIYDEANGMIFDEFIENYAVFMSELKDQLLENMSDDFRDGLFHYRNAENEIEQSDAALIVQRELFWMMDQLA